MLFVSILISQFVTCLTQPDFFERPPPPGPLRPWGPPPPWHRNRGPPPFGPPPPWDRPPPPWRRPPWHRRPPWGLPPPPPPPEPEPQQDQPQVMFSQDIDKVVNSVNQNTAAFQRPGESYDKVIQIMSSYFNRKSGSQYDINTVIPSSGIYNNEMAANSKIAAVMFESDMALTVSQMNKVAQNGFRVKRKMNLNGTTWSRNIPYRFLDTDGNWQSQITNGLRHYERNTCIRFSLNGGGSDYLVFSKGEGCYSSVGRLGGPQEISIGDGCETLGIITHEVGHALGFWHEQARPERDSYVRINRQNAINGLEGQFDKRSWSEVNEYSLPYDYGSVMHYGPKSFSKSSTMNTVEPVDPAFINTIGNRVEPSFLDLKLLNTAFCSNICTNRINCQHGGYADPNNCGQCTCPTGLEGTYCERLQTSNCGVELPRADYSWRNISYSGSSDCYWRIVSANGGNVRFELTYVMYRCSPVCEEFVEMKAEYSHEATGYRQCCKAVLGERISKGNSVLIISKATQNSQFVLRYREDGTAPTQRPPPVRVAAPRSYSLLWSGWTRCSENCGSCGTQYRERCTSTTNCLRSAKQTRVCNTQPCAQGTTRGKRSVLQTQISHRVKRLNGWCCARFVLSRGVCVPVRTGVTHPN